MRRRLLAWYDANRRDLVWRHTRDPYAIWVSEIMLQQTRVAVVIERYKAFLERFPTVEALAEAPEQDVLALWSGLGYYRRARMLHKAAREVTETLGGTLPATAKDLKQLPGIGSYTAAAIASIAHGESVAVVDGNVERVLCRVQGWHADGKSGATALRRKVESLAGDLLDPARPGDFNQAMMELGATLCTPKSPQCLVCAFAPECITRGEHKTAARPKMVNREIGCALALRQGEKPGPRHREVLLEQRAESNTVMPGLWQLPMLRESAVPEEWLRMTVRHAIMQTNYTVHVRDVEPADIDGRTVPDGARRWVPLAEAASMALTGLARKVLARAHLLPRAATIARPQPSDVV